MKTIVFDLETTIHDTARRFCNPFDKQNSIVTFAWKRLDLSDEVYVTHNPDDFWHAMQDAELIVGHNLKFDIVYLLAKFNTPTFLKDKKLHDTMVVEYLLNYQQQGNLSLNACSLKYGGTQKDDRLKEFWDAGVDTWDIPKDILFEYAKHDIINTDIVYQAQKKQLHKMQALIDSQMEDLLALCLIEYNGMKLDIDFAKKKIAEFEAADYSILNDFTPKDLPFEFNWKSTKHLGALLFGGIIEYVTKEPILKKINKIYEEVLLGHTEEGEPIIDRRLIYYDEVPGEYELYKTGDNKGKPRYKNTTKQYFFPGYLPANKKVTTDKGNLKVDYDVLVKFKNNKEIKLLIDTLLELKDKEKQLNTYFAPFIECASVDGFIHGELKPAQTVTGRLSSSSPNLQNLPRSSSSEVKGCVISRFDNGVIIEIDASQLEIVVQAYLAQDDRMIAELNKGTDFHCLRLAAKENMAYEDVYKLCKIDKDKKWDAKRTNTKAFSFQRAYGAGAQAISKSTGLAIDDVKKLIETEDELFPNVKLFNDTNIEIVNKNKQVLFSNETTTIIGKLPSITGRIYSFEEEDAPDFLQKRGILKSFSPTQIKNYPIQGFGAEILAEFRGNLARKLIGREDRVVMINTVHDSIIFDCKQEIAETFMHWLKKESEKVVYLIQNRYNLVVNVPLKFDIKYGKNWKELGDFI